ADLHSAFLGRLTNLRRLTDSRGTLPLRPTTEEQPKNNRRRHTANDRPPPASRSFGFLAGSPGGSCFAHSPPEGSPPHRHPSHRPTAVRRWPGSARPGSIADASHPSGDATTMYRGSRLAASFLLVLTGFGVLAIALFTLPSAVGHGAAWWIVPL